MAAIFSRSQCVVNINPVYIDINHISTSTKIMYITVTSHENDTPLRNIHLVQGRLVCGSCLSVQWYSTPVHPLGTGAACLWIMSVSSMILLSGTSTWYRGGLFVDHVCQFNYTPLRNLGKKVEPLSKPRTSKVNGSRCHVHSVPFVWTIP